MKELPLFAYDERPAQTLTQVLKENPLFRLAHPYARYGLALALLRTRPDEEFEHAQEQDLPEMLAREIEDGLNHFRMETSDNPEIASELRFQWISLDRLRQNKSLIQGQLSALGKYLAPTLLTTDGDAKGTFDNAEKILKALRDGQSFASNCELKRSFAPTTAKINNGRGSQAPQKTSLLEAACTLVTTVTEYKPASWVAKLNTVIIPDLPLDELRDFIELFRAMLTTQAGQSGHPMRLKIVREAAVTETAAVAPKKVSKKKKANGSTDDSKKDNKPKAAFKRPPLFNGNYPYAPRNTAFGAAGLLAAIGRWAVQAHEEKWAERVLDSLAGRPLYLISYDSISQVQFSHHVTKLAKKNKLSLLIDKLAYETKLYSELDSTKARWENTNYQLFDFHANRFLQLFDPPSFGNFLAFRAEYAPELNTLFEEYFMRDNNIDRAIVTAARAYGQWLNRTAYFVADREIPKETNDRPNKVKKEKAKILIELESAAMSAETAQDMFHRISTRAGRLLLSDAPAEATPFIDAAMSGDGIQAKEAQQMLVAYMRLRATKTGEDNAKTDADKSSDGYGATD